MSRFADELRSIGLPKPALMTSTVARYRALFEAPTVIEPARPR